MKFICKRNFYNRFVVGNIYDGEYRDYTKNVIDINGYMFKNTKDTNASWIDAPICMYFDDLKETRKQKLEKICSNQEIK